MIHLLFGFIFIFLSCFGSWGPFPWRSKTLVLVVDSGGRDSGRSGKLRFGIDVSILNLLAVGTSSWLSGRSRGGNGVKKSAVEHWFAKES